MFDGGSVNDFLPKAGTTNIYHLIEYANGHFMIRKIDNAYSKAYIDTMLGNIESLINAI